MRPDRFRALLQLVGPSRLRLVESDRTSPGSVARPSRYGNPLVCIDAESKARAAEWFAVGLDLRRARSLSAAPCMHDYPSDEQIVTDLAGRDLGCWCHLFDLHADGLPLGTACADCDPCHASTLLDLANPLENR